MTTTNQNVEILRGAYEAWIQSRGRSVEEWVKIASPDIALQSLADEHEEGRFGAVPVGHTGFRQYLTDLVNHWIMESYDVDRYIAEGDQVVAVARTAWRNRATNKRVACPLVDVWTFKDGLATSVLELFDTAAMVAAATPDPA